jgi:hypothetical protein
VRQKFHQPFLIHMIEKAFDIGINDVGVRLFSHRLAQGQVINKSVPFSRPAPPNPGK